MRPERPSPRRARESIRRVTEDQVPALAVRGRLSAGSAARRRAPRRARPRRRARSRFARIALAAPPASESTNVALAGAARERLDPERARARVQVEHREALDRAEHAEQRLAHAVRGRPRGRAARRAERRACPPNCARDDPHAAIGSTSSAPKRRSSASRSSAFSGSASSGSARSSSIEARARALQQLGVLRQARDPELGQPATAWCRAGRPPRAASGRSRPAGSRRAPRRPPPAAGCASWLCESENSRQ